MTLTQRSDIASTRLDSLPEVSRKCVLDNAGKIIAKLNCFSDQSEIDSLKVLFHMLIIGTLRDSRRFRQIQNIIRNHRERVIDLMLDRIFMRGKDPRLAVDIIDEILALEHNHIPRDRYSSGASSDSAVSYDWQTEFPPLNYGGEHSFFHSDKHVAVITPNPHGGYTVRATAEDNTIRCYQCDHYEVDVDGGWVTIYDQNKQIVWGYAFNSYT